MTTKPTVETCLHVEQLNIPVRDKPAKWKLYYAAKIGTEQSTLPASVIPSKWKLFYAANQGRSTENIDRIKVSADLKIEK